MSDGRPLSPTSHVRGDTDAEPDADGMSRHMPLEKSGARERHWALSLEAFRAARAAL